MKVSPLMHEILAHRLTAPDAIAEALDAEDYAAVQAACREVRAKLATGALDLDGLTPLQQAVLRDAASGSTYFADSDDAVMRGQLSRGKLRAADQAADRLEKWLGVPVPRC